MVWFDSNFQKQLLFNFSATHATWKKSASMYEGHASRLREVDLNIAPTTFSHEVTDCHELSWYILEDLLPCPVGCCVIACIRAGDNRNLAEQSYSDQGKCIVESRNKNGIVTESWWMSGNPFYVLQGTISWATLNNKIWPKNLSRSRFMKYFLNCSGDFGISFVGCMTFSLYLGKMWSNTHIL